MERVYKIGDYYDDGVKQGLVIQVSEDGFHGKILSLQQCCCCWADELEAIRSEIRAYSKSDGMKNQAVAMEQDCWQQRYPAFAFCASLGEGWYLPAMEELETFLRNDLSVLNAVNQRLEQLGAPIVKGWYWSSTERGYFAYDDEYLVARVQVKDFKYPWNYRIKDEDKSGAGDVRAVARF